MEPTLGLPGGIRIMRRFSLESGVPVSRRRFERLVDSLNACAAGSRPKMTRCSSCPYLDECLERFDAICARVAMAKEKKALKKGS